MTIPVPFIVVYMIGGFVTFCGGAFLISKELRNDEMGFSLLLIPVVILAAIFWPIVVLYLLGYVLSGNAYRDWYEGSDLKKRRQAAEYQRVFDEWKNGGR